MRDLIKRSFDLWTKMRWLKMIDKEVDKYNNLRKKLDCQIHIVNILKREFNERYPDNKI